MSSSGTGYKLRRQISKALQRRSEAIKKALNRYNTQAARLDPPGPQLSWKEIVEYSFISEFDLLRHSRNDIRSERWAQPACREATLKFFRLCRAKEELVRLNIEIRRLRTWIDDKEKKTMAIIAKLSRSDPSLSQELQRRWVLRAAVNEVHIHRLDTIERLPGFTGIQSIGSREGFMNSLEGDRDVLDNETMNNEVEEQVSVITEFLLAVDR